jgi:hypothetical protein
MANEQKDVTEKDISPTWPIYDKGGHYRGLGQKAIDDNIDLLHPGEDNLSGLVKLFMKHADELIKHLRG